MSAVSDDFLEFGMKKVFINGDHTTVRTLSPFAYKDTIKTLDKSNEARVTLDGARAFRTAVTSGRDVKSGSGAVKYHLYFYMTESAATARDTTRREFMPITAEEFRAYKNDPAYSVVIESATPATEQPAEPVTEQADDADEVAELIAAIEAEQDTMAEEQPAPEPTKRKRARR